MDRSYPLSDKDIQSFKKNGHIYLARVAQPDELGKFRHAIRLAVKKYNSETRPLNERDTYGKAFLQIMNLWVRDENVRKFTFARRFAEIAAKLLGVPSVRLYHDQALFKESGGGPTPWHQDQFYWPLQSDKTITLWMPLVDVTEDMGTMTFASGSHSGGRLIDQPISDESEKEIARIVGERDLPLCRYKTFAPGDATFHAGWTLHRAEGNTTSQMREVMTVIYMASDMKVKAPENQSQQLDLDWWLKGASPGESAATPLNPILF